MAFLLLHGLEGSGPTHWQSWLAGQLRERGLEVAFPQLPEADNPRLDRWLEALDAELARLPVEETTVICHSLGCLLWLHYAARPPTQAVARALLVAPTQPDADDPQSPGFRPTPLHREGVAAAARETLLVCSTDDPWGPPVVARRIGESIGAPIDWLENASHINPTGGFGPWPELEAWALGERRPLSSSDTDVDDRYHLERFELAQDDGDTYARAVAELRAGRKTSHWMWFVFPQIAGLGRSSMSKTYAISSLGEAKAYLAHPVLGARLLECARILTKLSGRSAQDIFGGTDALKLHSSMTLFARIAPSESPFQQVLAQYFAGVPDAGTEQLLRS